jgi:peptidyl-prolyl cis-trans isomerase A (cyclophilin A)
MNKLAPIILLIIFTRAYGCDSEAVYPDKTFPEVEITTSLGIIVVELDRNRAPITVNNFLKYIKMDKFKNTIFHRVEKDFVVQGGGYNAQFDEIDECDKIFNESGNGLKNTEGTIAMARYDDPHSATSQFYFNLSDNPSLDPNAKNWGYTVFGEIVEGMDILKKISQVPVDFSIKLNSENVPIEPITIKQITVN